MVIKVIGMGCENCDKLYENVMEAVRETGSDAVVEKVGDLMEIVKLIGSDVLPDDQKLIIEVARVIRVGFLQQNFFHDQDTYVSLEKQLKMMRVILHLYEKSQALVARQIPISKLMRLGLFDKLVKMKYDIPNDQLEKFEEYEAEIDQKTSELLRN